MKIIPLLILLTLPVFAGEINTLTPEEKANGWKLLFNGEDLSEFRIYGSEKKPGPGWRVENGILKKANKIPGGNIITKEKFGDFTLSWEWKITPKGNNGIKYLVTETRPSAPGPEYQMLDDTGHPDSRNGTKRLTASLYDILPPADEKPLKTPGEWNLSKIVIKGKQVEHWLNGSLVLTYQLESPELKAAVTKSKFAKADGFTDKINGHIMLTDHIDECSFRNLKILPEVAKK